MIARLPRQGLAGLPLGQAMRSGRCLLQSAAPPLVFDSHKSGGVTTRGLTCPDASIFPGVQAGVFRRVSADRAPRRVDARSRRGGHISRLQCSHPSAARRNVARRTHLDFTVTSDEVPTQIVAGDRDNASKVRAGTLIASTSSLRHRATPQKPASAVCAAALGVAAQHAACRTRTPIAGAARPQPPTRRCARHAGPAQRQPGAWHALSSRCRGLAPALRHSSAGGPPTRAGGAPQPW